MENGMEMSRVMLVVTHDSKFDILTDIIDDLSRAHGDRQIVDYDIQPMCKFNSEGEVELG